MLQTFIANLIFSTFIPCLWISQPPGNQAVLLYLQSAKFAGGCLNWDLWDYWDGWEMSELGSLGLLG